MLSAIHGRAVLLGLPLLLAVLPSVHAAQKQPAGATGLTFRPNIQGFDIYSAAAKVGVKPQALLRASRMTRRHPEKLVHLLSTDHSASLSPSGVIQFGCKLHDHDDPADISSVLGFNPPVGLATSGAAATSGDPAEAFTLHSRPSSPRKIYLEFNGCVTEGTDGWNKYLELEKIVTPEYDSDGKAGISDDERLEIITIWQGVAEHFSLWDVDVTTEDPGHEGIERSDYALDQEYGIRVCVGGDSSWTGGVIGGIALLNSFGWVNKPGGQINRDCFVFSSNLRSREDGKVNLGYVWKSISHEVGHTVGLLHKGLKLPDNTVQEYYKIPPQPGLWAPIMGVPGKGLYVQWSNGSYPAEVGPPSNTDDDLAIISATLPLLVDEPGDSPKTARVLCANTHCTQDNQAPGLITTTVDARISSGADRDYYNVTVENVTAPLSVQLDYVPNWQKRSLDRNGSVFQQNWRISNLRLALQFVQEGVQVEPVTVSTWSTQQDFDVKLPLPGTYTFWVQPTQQLSSSNSSIQLPTNYGNVGDYTLRAVFTANKIPEYIPNQAPVAAADSFNTTAGTPIAHLDLLGNDHDPDGDNLTLVGVTVPAYGTLKQTRDGTYRYTPSKDAVNVTDSFLYMVTDGKGEAATAVATVTIIPGNSSVGESKSQKAHHNRRRRHNGMRTRKQARRNAASAKNAPADRGSN